MAVKRVNMQTITNTRVERNHCEFSNEKQKAYKLNCFQVACSKRLKSQFLPLSSCSFSLPAIQPRVCKICRLVDMQLFEGCKVHLRRMKMFKSIQRCPTQLFSGKAPLRSYRNTPCIMYIYIYLIHVYIFIYIYTYITYIYIIVIRLFAIFLSVSMRGPLCPSWDACAEQTQELEIP